MQFSDDGQTRGFGGIVGDLAAEIVVLYRIKSTVEVHQRQRIEVERFTVRWSQVTRHDALR